MPFQKLLKSLLATTVSLYGLSLVIPGLILAPGLQNLLLVSAVLYLLNRLIRPIIKIFLLPLNIVTFGLSRWLTTIAVLYLLDFLLTEIDIQGFALRQVKGVGYLLPDIVVGTFIATILIALLLTLVKRLLSWLIR
ncbi:MAG: phage holin family protein [Candidatus Chisholmbacteria bacterium]|nr:phage holin family protein [Candidatus Chisholmbacteria bacterium]